MTDEALVRTATVRVALLPSPRSTHLPWPHSELRPGRVSLLQCQERSLAAMSKVLDYSKFDAIDEL